MTITRGAVPSTFARFATDESLTIDQTRALIASGKIAATTLLQRNDGTEWKPAADYAELHDAFDTAPKPVVRGTKPVRRFAPKFSAPEEASPTLPARFIGGWFIFIGLLFVSGTAGRFDFFIFGALILGGVFLVIFPQKLVQLSRHRMFRPSTDAGENLSFGIVTLAGLALLGFAVYHGVREVRSTNWPTADATVTRTWFDDDDRGFTYRFELGRAKYWGNATGELDVGQAVRVHYNPDDPTDSIIGDGVGFHTLFMLSVALTMLVALAGFMLQRRKNRRAQGA